MATYTVQQRRTLGVTGRQVLGGSRDAAVSVALQAAATGPTGTEGHVFTCDLTGMTGATGIYAAATNTTTPLTGATYSATTYEGAVQAAITAQLAVGPTGYGSNLEVQSAST